MGHFSMLNFWRAYVVVIGEMFPQRGFNWELTMSKLVLYHCNSSRGPKSLYAKGVMSNRENRVGGSYDRESLRDVKRKNFPFHFPFTFAFGLVS